jgi:deoxyribose-phosphate aldolase
MGIKAAGGIRSFQVFRELMAAGATRIGASAGISILREATAAGAEHK